jgi:hypothetical protein
MACCILIAVLIGAALAIKNRLLGMRAKNKEISPLTWRLHSRD